MKLSQKTQSKSPGYNFIETIVCWEFDYGSYAVMYGLETYNCLKFLNDSIPVM